MSLLLFDSFESDAEAAVVVSNLATAASIRDRIIALIAGRTPTSLADDRFRAYRNDRGADFRAWAEENAAAALRRFQVRESSDDNEPDVTNTTEEAIEVEFEIPIAYPQTHRYGGDNGLDRDDVANEDWKALKRLIGCEGRLNFSGTNDCTPLGATRVFERGDNGIDYSTITARFRYFRSTT